MDYEEKYIKALERAKDMLAYKEVRQEDMEYLFPELEESKDERMRREIIDFLRLPHPQFVGKRDHEKWIAWLEKQGEEEYALKSFRDKDVHEFMQYIENQAKAYEFNLPNRGYDIYAFAKDILHWLEKQGKKKPNSQMEKCIKCQFNFTGYCDGTCILKNNEQKPADKAEPKFKVRDWIVDYVGNYWRVVKVRPNYYELDGDDGVKTRPTRKYVDEKYHLWTIEDAKDGDVLDCEGCEYLLFKSFSNTDGRIKLYCWYNVQTNNFHGRGTDSKLRQEANIHPATKEQRELLFEKMNEAEYKWDAEKKELKKIEVVSKESEDERIRKELIEQVAYIIPNDDEVDGEGNTLPTYQKRIDKYRAWLEKH